MDTLFIPKSFTCKETKMYISTLNTITVSSLLYKRNLASIINSGIIHICANTIIVDFKFNYGSIVGMEFYRKQVGCISNQYKTIIYFAKVHGTHKLIGISWCSNRSFGVVVDPWEQ